MLRFVVSVLFVFDVFFTDVYGFICLPEGYVLSQDFQPARPFPLGPGQPHPGSVSLDLALNEYSLSGKLRLARIS